jgi:NAD(P)-dependent dehydrogenase (short-subunit alcohol dehydrogenase family)
MDRTQFSSALIVGAGSGLSASLARLFKQHGMKIALAARNIAKLKPLQDGTGAAAFSCDATDRLQVQTLFEEASAENGEPDVVVYNAGGHLRGPLIDLDPAAVERLLSVAFGGFLVAQEAAKRMLPKGRGAILFTGASASMKGYAQSAPFAMGKFALRGLAQSMARELSPQGIHVAHFVIDGGIASPSRQAGFHARSRCHRGKLSARADATAQRLDLGGRAAALGRAVLNMPSWAARRFDVHQIAQSR